MVSASPSGPSPEGYPTLDLKEYRSGRSDTLSQSLRDTCLPTLSYKEIQSREVEFQKWEGVLSCHLSAFEEQERVLLHRLSFAEVSPREQSIYRRTIQQAAVCGAFLGELPGRNLPIARIMALSTKVMLAIRIVDECVDSSEREKTTKEEAICSLLNAFKGTGSPNCSIDQKHEIALTLGAEIHEEVRELPEAKRFFIELERLAHVARHQFSFARSLAGAVKLGSQSFAVLATLPHFFDAGLSPRFRKAARHFGALTQIANDLAGADEDRNNEIITFANFEKNVNSERDLLQHDVVRNTLMSHALKCFECLTTKERNAYRFLGKQLEDDFPALRSFLQEAWFS